MSLEHDDPNFQREVRKRSIKSFAWFFLAIALVVAGWLWLMSQPDEFGANRALRRVLRFNETVNAAVKSPTHLAKTFDKSQAVKNVKVNGPYGLSDGFDSTSWKLRVVNKGWGADSVIYVTLDDIKKLPRTDVVFDFKCIEGWSQITWWSGVKLSDFMKQYNLGSRNGRTPNLDDVPSLTNYIGMVTPDSGYYVGIDMKSALSPQTILCYAMNGNPLPENQGAPLRLIIPNKYGVKHIKRIGTMRFVDRRPRDYWFERGYDYDCAL